MWMLSRQSNWYLQVFKASIDKATSFAEVESIMNQLNQLKLQIGYIPMVQHFLDTDIPIV